MRMAADDTNANEVFRRSTMNRIASADELDHYIKVTNPSAWVVVVAGLLLIVGVIVWAVVAIVPVTVNTTGIMLETPQNGKSVVMCVVDKPTAQKIKESGATASVNGVEASSVAVDITPASRAEIIDLLDNEFLAETFNLSDWNFMVTILLDKEPEHSDYLVGISAGAAFLVPVDIVVAETQPINIVMGKN